MSSQTDAERLERIRAEYEATTQGQWKAEDVTGDWEPEKEYCMDPDGDDAPCKEDGEYCSGHYVDELWQVSGPTMISFDDYVFLTEADAKFMANAHEHIPFLLAQLAAAKQAGIA